MSDKKTSAETAASTPDGAELVRIVQSGVNKKATLTQLLGDLTDGTIPVSNGNILIDSLLSDDGTDLSYNDNAFVKDDGSLLWANSGGASALGADGYFRDWGGGTRMSPSGLLMPNGIHMLGTNIAMNDQSGVGGGNIILEQGYIDIPDINGNLSQIASGTNYRSDANPGGVSLFCASGYELNWANGHLSNWNSTSPTPILMDVPFESIINGGPAYSMPAGGSIQFNGLGDNAWQMGKLNTGSTHIVNPPSALEIIVSSDAITSPGFVILNSDGTSLFEILGSDVGRTYMGGPIVDASNVITIHPLARTLNNEAGAAVANWATQVLFDSGAVTSVDWASRLLNDPAALPVMSWGNRVLYDPSVNPIMDWTNDNNVDTVNAAYYFHNSVLQGDGGGLTGVTAAVALPIVAANNDVVLSLVGDGTDPWISIDANGNLLFQGYGPTVVPAGTIGFDSNGHAAVTGPMSLDSDIFMDGSIKDQTSSAPAFNVLSRILFDAAGVYSADCDNRQLLDASINLSVDWNSRILSDNASGFLVDWSNTGVSDANYFFNTSVLQGDGSGLTGIINLDSGWTANADNGDKTAVIPSSMTTSSIQAALNILAAGSGDLLIAVADKVKAIEYALTQRLLPNA